MLSQAFRNCIHLAITGNFSVGEYFDTHTVINEIFRNKDYLKLYLTDFNSATEINQYHAIISPILVGIESLASLALLFCAFLRDVKNIPTLVLIFGICSLVCNVS